MTSFFLYLAMQYNLQTTKSFKFVMNILSERNRTKKPIWLLIYLFLLGWEDKQKVAKEAYDVEYKAWLEGGGAEAIKQVPSTQFLFYLNGYIK